MGRPRKNPLPEPEKDSLEEIKKSFPAVKKLSIDSPGVKCDEVEPGSIAERQLHFYANQEMVMTRIMRGAGDKPGAFETVIVNNLRINILKGVQVKLPIDVAAIIDDAFYRTDQAINNTKIKNPFTGYEKPAVLDQQSELDKANY